MALAFVATFVITTLLTGLGYKRAVQARTVLDQRFDTQDEFTPSAIIDPDRMERFLEVRRSLIPQELLARFGGLGRQEMMELYCPAAVELEVVLTVDSGAWYDHR
jgi:hypothetical protein